MMDYQKERHLYVVMVGFNPPTPYVHIHEHTLLHFVQTNCPIFELGMVILFNA
jgi:hypothetical protein